MRDAPSPELALAEVGVLVAVGAEGHLESLTCRQRAARARPRASNSSTTARERLRVERISKPAASRWQQSRQMPIRSPPPAGSISSASSSKSAAERPGCRRCSRAGSGSARSRASASRITFRPASPTAPSGSPLRAPACRTTPSAPIPSPTASAWVSEASDLRADLGVVARAVDQVDGVDARSTRPASLAIASRKAAKSSSAVVRSAATSAGSGGRSGSRRSRARSPARRPCRARPPWKRARRSASAPVNASVASTSLRPVADGRPPHRRRADGTLQLARCARRSGGDPGPADRGHRPRALDRRRTSSRSSTRCAGSSSTGTRARSARTSGASATRERLEELLEPGAPTGTRRPPPTSAREGGARRRRLPRRAGREERRSGGPPAGPRRGRDGGRRPDPGPVRLRERLPRTTS